MRHTARPLVRRPLFTSAPILIAAAFFAAPMPTAAQLRPGDILYVDRIAGESVSSLHTVGVRPDGSPTGIDVRGGTLVDLLTGSSGIYTANAGQIFQIDPATGDRTPIFTTQDYRWGFLSLEPAGTFLAATSQRPARSRRSRPRTHNPPALRRRHRHHAGATQPQNPRTRAMNVQRLQKPGGTGKLSGLPVVNTNSAPRAQTPPTYHRRGV